MRPGIADASADTYNPTNTNSGSDAGIDSYACAAAHCNSYFCAHRYRRADAHPCSGSNADSNARTDSHTQPYFDSCTDGDSGTDALIHTSTTSHGHPDSSSNSNAGTHSHARTT